ncbi:MAG: 3-dehydroquinate synthase [Candidatus Hydrogenedentes bacterium]|nr:3-dehydroquinate synthase [Candidatus Hydrogenedentota bacterium]
MVGYKETRVAVELGDRSYNIDIGPGLLDEIGTRLAKIHTPGKVAVITDKQVGAIYSERVHASLCRAGYTPDLLVVRPGEKSKTTRVATRLCGDLLAAGFDRGDLIVALGGGVVGDLAGFVAAVYMRGIAYVQVPTTLLAQVDSSVGGKTAVDHPECKNLIGVFHQPRYVLIDPLVLKSLPVREMRCGMAEVLKHTVLGDPELFESISADPVPFVNAEHTVMAESVRRSCEFKAGVVAEDEREGGLRAILNLGHTAGHAIEAAAAYKGLRHGEAVAYGLVAAARLSERLGVAETPIAESIETALRGLGLARPIPVQIRGHSPSTIFDLLLHDKKFRGGRLKFVLPERIGSVRIVDGVPAETVREVLDEIVAEEGSDA